MTPLKCLGFQISPEVFCERLEALHLKRESTASGTTRRDDLFSWSLANLA